MSPDLLMALFGWLLGLISGPDEPLLTAIISGALLGLLGLRPGKAAITAVSIFMLSSTATTSSASTSSPIATGTETTTPGAWLRTAPPSSCPTRSRLG